MSTRNISVLPLLRKQTGMRKLLVGGMMFGLLTGVCFDQRGSQRAMPSARPGPTANTMAPNARTVAPTANTVASPTIVKPPIIVVGPTTNSVGTPAIVKPPIIVVGPTAGLTPQRDDMILKPVNPNAVQNVTTPPIGKMPPSIVEPP